MLWVGAGVDVLSGCSGFVGVCRGLLGLFGGVRGCSGWLGRGRWSWRGPRWRSRARSPVRLWLGPERPLLRSVDLPDRIVASVALGHPEVSRCATPTGRRPQWRVDKVCGPGRVLACDTSDCPHRATLRGRSQHATEPAAGALVGGLGVQSGGDNSLPFLSWWRRARQPLGASAIEPRRGEERGRG